MQSRFKLDDGSFVLLRSFQGNIHVVLGNIDPVPEETRSGILPACRCLGAIYLVRTKLSMAVVRRRHVLSQ